MEDIKFNFFEKIIIRLWNKFIYGRIVKHVQKQIEDKVDKVIAAELIGKGQPCYLVNGKAFKCKPDKNFRKK